MAHREISVLEAFSLFDKSIHKTSSSTTAEYVNLYEDRKQYFKEVSDESETSVKLEHSNKIFEKQMTNVDRYLERINGDHLSLAEESHPKTQLSVPIKIREIRTTLHC